MSGQTFRLPKGGEIDRDLPIEFTFDGRTLSGFAGDTLASALLANGIHLVGRSFKYHRPRGIYAAGVEEPNALLRVDRGHGRVDPNVRATEVELVPGMAIESQNRWPSLAWDIGAINDLLSPLLPAGFYYKTFKWPASAWRFYEERIRAAAGLGRAPDQADPDRYAHRYEHCEILIVGGGLAGLLIARHVVRAGLRVILVDDQARLGGWFRIAGLQSDLSAPERPPCVWVDDAIAELSASDNLQVLTRTRAVAYYNHNLVGLLERVSDHVAEPRPDLPRERFWKVRAKTIVLATGAIERSLLFANNDRPGIMLADAAYRYLRQYSVMLGHNIVVHTNNDSAYETVWALHRQNLTVRAVIDSRNHVAGDIVHRTGELGVRLIQNATVLKAHGGKRINGITIDAAEAPADGNDIRRERLTCDALLVSGGWNPNVALHAQSRGSLRFSSELGSYVPGEATQAVWSVGACSGVFAPERMTEQAARAVEEILDRLGTTVSTSPLPDFGEVRPEMEMAGSISRSPNNQKKVFIDFQNDVTTADIRLATREGYRSVEHVKRYTTTGMGTDQGRTSSVNAIHMIAASLGQPIESIGTTTFRPPYTPVSFGALVGANCHDHFDPERKTPMHEWAKDEGAVFEDVGQWKRARYFPRHGESLDEAVQRESKATRRHCGLLDASTLGKIDVQGRDAAKFLDLMYTNSMAKLGIGRCRYGLLLHEDGMVFDDGVVARLNEDHFHVTTTTGGAARVYAWFERWLQTEWTDLEVFCTPVTDQWATMTVSGPVARAVIAQLIDPELIQSTRLPHMAMAEAKIAGVPGRIFRISFTGEISFELNVPADYGLHVWAKVRQAGEAQSLTVYGTETMHLLRAEKGFIIIGQETDGSVTPSDLGMDWIVSRKKDDFVGMRSLRRTDLQRSDRKRLVGLETSDPGVVLEDGAHVVLDPNIGPPTPMLGHVTSSYFSPNLDRSIALALVRGGPDLVEQRFFASQLDGPSIEVRVVSPCFFDPEGRRLHG